jgi:hypothetical protein
MSVVVIVVVRLLCCLLSSLNEGRRLQDRGPLSHKLPFFPFLRCFFPAAVPFCSWVGDSFATQEFLFSFFSRVFSVSSCERLTAYRCSLTACFVEELRTASAAPSRAHFQARTVYRISEYVTSRIFSHAYSRLGICHQYFGPSLKRTSYKLPSF